ncbi:hypothetical protein LTR95_012067 [Oleoguttula sp. CCFEE 5521]
MASPSTILTALLAATTTTSPLPAQTLGPQTVNLVSRLCADQSSSCSDTTYLAWLNTSFSLNITTSSLTLSSSQNIDINLVKCQIFFTGGDAGPILTADTPITSSSGLIDIGNVTCSVSDDGKGQDQAGQIRPGDNATTTWVHRGDAIPVTTTTATGAVPTITGWGGAVDGGNGTTATGSTPPSTTTYTGGASGLEVARLLAAIAAAVRGTSTDVE